MSPRVTRSQADDFLEDSRESFLLCPPEEGRTRQEQRDSVDINLMLSRHGVQVPMRPYEVGDVDFDLDLQTAYSVSAQARDLYSRLDEDAKERYPTLGSYLEAAMAQELDFTPKPKPPADPLGAAIPVGGTPTPPVP